VVVISLCHQHWILAEQWPSALIFFPPRQESPLYVNVSLGRRL
jgi:hypothetical protein